VVRAPSKSAKLCGRENSYTHKSAPKDVRPLAHHNASREPSLAHGVPQTKGFLGGRAVKEPSSTVTNEVPIVTMEVISDNAEVGQLVPLTCEFIVDFR
jgi:hypothetical protein